LASRLTLMVTEDRSHVKPLPEPGPVRRLTFAYDGDQITLVADQRVTMIAPPSHSLERVESTPGFAVILRDASGIPVYRRVLENPVRHDVEVFSPDPKESVRQMPAQHPKGVFVVLVPEIAGAQSLELFGSPLRAEAHREPPRMLARFALTTK